MFLVLVLLRIPWRCPFSYCLRRTFLLPAILRLMAFDSTIVAPFLRLLQAFRALMSFSTTFEAVSIKSLFSERHVLIGVGGPRVECLCAFFVAAQRAFKFGKSHLLFPLNNHRCTRIILAGKAF